jgi:hypothetical protein
MSNPSRNSVSNLRDSPRHGRTRSLSMNHPAPPELPPSPNGPTSPPQGHQPLPSLRRAAHQPPNDLQNFSERSIEPFCRWAFIVVDARGREQPNYNFTSDIENAIWVSETIVHHPHLSLSLHTNKHAGHVRQRPSYDPRTHPAHFRSRARS